MSLAIQLSFDLNWISKLRLQSYSINFYSVTKQRLHRPPNQRKNILWLDNKFKLSSKGKKVLAKHKLYHIFNELRNLTLMTKTLTKSRSIKNFNEQ